MITRKEFLVQLAGSGWVLGGCGGGGGGYEVAAPTPAPAPGTPSSCTATQIAGNHGHALAIPVADLSSAAAMTYDIRGAADHSHAVTFTPAQLSQLKSGSAVTVVSTTAAGHSHDVTEACT